MTTISDYDCVLVVLDFWSRVLQSRSLHRQYRDDPRGLNIMIDNMYVLMHRIGNDNETIHQQLSLLTRYCCFFQIVLSFGADRFVVAASVPSYHQMATAVKKVVS
jgi:hypothetical protein